MNRFFLLVALVSLMLMSGACNFEKTASLQETNLTATPVSKVLTATATSLATVTATLTPTPSPTKTPTTVPTPSLTPTLIPTPSLTPTPTAMSLSVITDTSPLIIAPVLKEIRQAEPYFNKEVTLTPVVDKQELAELDFEHKTAKVGNYIYSVRDGVLKVVDTVPAASVTPTLTISLTVNNISQIQVMNNYAYINTMKKYDTGSWKDEIWVLDVTNPARPREIGYYPVEDTKTIVTKDYVYSVWSVCGWEPREDGTVSGGCGWGLTIFDFRDPTQPVNVGYINLKG